MQEAFVQVLRNIAGLRDVTAFRPWFYQIVVNAAKRLSRGGPMQTVPLDLEYHDKADATVSAPDEVALTADEAARLRTALDQLNEAHRVPVFLHYFTGLSEQEIAGVRVPDDLRDRIKREAVQPLQRRRRWLGITVGGLVASLLLLAALPGPRAAATNTFRQAFHLGGLKLVVNSGTEPAPEPPPAVVLAPEAEAPG